MEACKSEYQSFVQEQRQLERTSTRSRPDVGNVLTSALHRLVSVCGAIYIRYV